MGSVMRTDHIDTGMLRARIAWMVGGLVAVNGAGWVWAFLAFGHVPVLMGTALLAYGLGLRHAIDADHIAAIDNVTRKLMQDGQRPVAVGVFFSPLGTRVWWSSHRVSWRWQPPP